jgi:hypothetical protein
MGKILTPKFEEMQNAGHGMHCTKQRGHLADETKIFYHEANSFGNGLSTETHIKIGHKMKSYLTLKEQ